MARRDLVIVLLAALALFAYVGYSSYDARRAGVTGQVFADDSSRSKSKSEARGPASSGSSTANISTADTAAPPQEIETIVYPSASSPAAQAPASGGGIAQVTQAQQAALATAPGSDTISPNPPNGMVFAGSGRYQLYRQGNITWRLDTETGRSCIIFATDEEWRKPRVYKAGCGRI